MAAFFSFPCGILLTKPPCNTVIIRPTNRNIRPCRNRLHLLLYIYITMAHLLHGGEVKPDVGQEGEGELHARV